MSCVNLPVPWVYSRSSYNLLHEFFCKRVRWSLLLTQPLTSRTDFFKCSGSAEARLLQPEKPSLQICTGDVNGPGLDLHDGGRTGPAKSLRLFPEPTPEMDVT